MTPAAIQLIEQKIEAARKRGDGREIGRLRADLPFEERQRIFGVWTTAAERPRSTPLPLAQLRPAATANASPSERAGGSTPGWPASIRMDRSLLSDLDFDGRESGGFLVGPTDSTEPEVWNLVEAYNERNATWRSVELDLPRALDALERLPLDRTIIGEYHLHPNGCGVSASSQDISAGAGLAKAFRRSHWVSLIIANPESRFAIRSDVGAYVIRPDGTHRTVHMTERSF